MDQIRGLVKLNSVDQLSDHFSLPTCRHLHMVVQLPPMCEYSRHPFMLPSLLIDALLFLYCRSLYIYICQFFILSYSPTSPLYVFSSIFTHLDMLAPIQAIQFLVHVPQHRRAFSKVMPHRRQRSAPYTPHAYDPARIDRDLAVKPGFGGA